MMTNLSGRSQTYLVAAITIAITTGCASITGTNSQNVSVQTKNVAGTEVKGASCELSNNKGKWFVTTPGSVGIHRSNDDMQVVCNKDGLEPGRAAVVSDTKGSMFGNIIFGGGIGAIIDHNSGAAYEYPAFIQVVMGVFTKLEPTKPADSTAQSSTPPPSQPAGTMQTVSSTSQTMAPQPAGSRDDQLRELKRLRDNNLISQEIYLERQKAVLDLK